MGEHREEINPDGKKTSPALQAGLVFLYSFFMRKIKKFKIPIYSYEIMRKAKKAGAQLEISGLSDERDFKEYVSQLAAAIEPAVVFDYFPPDDPDTAILGSVQKTPLTIAILTLGQPFCDKINKEEEKNRKLVNVNSAPVFMSAAAKIIADLAGQEAAQEGFELGKPMFIYSSPGIPMPENMPEKKSSPKNTNELPLFALPEEEPEAAQETPLYRDELIKKLFFRLEASKIGMTLENGNLFPQSSCAFSMEWKIKTRK